MIVRTFALLRVFMQHPHACLCTQAEAARGAASERAPQKGQGHEGLQGRPGVAGQSSQKRPGSTQPLDDEKLTKADQRRLARKMREAEWQAFNQTQPDQRCVEGLRMRWKIHEMFGPPPDAFRPDLLLQQRSQGWLGVFY